MRTIIISDSSCCLSAELLARYGVRVAPLALVIGGETVPDGSLPPSELFARVDASRAPVRSAAPAPGEFLSAFRAAMDEGADEVLCLTLSAAFSGTYESALAGVELGGGEVNVRVVDTGGLAMTHGFAVLAAARALEAGATAAEAAAHAQRVGAGGTLVGAIDTMRYLVKGGRVSRVLGWAAGALSIKQMLVFERGTAKQIGRTRTMARAGERLVHHAERIAAGRPVRVAVMHTDSGELALGIRDALCRRLSPIELLVTEFTSVMSVHTGPGFVGIAVCPDD